MSAEAPKNHGITGLVPPQGYWRRFFRNLHRIIFKESPLPASNIIQPPSGLEILAAKTSQVEADDGLTTKEQIKLDPLFEEMISGIDHRTQASLKENLVSTQPIPFISPWSDEFEVRALENQSRAYLAEMDPTITACLHSMATRTWDRDGFSFWKGFAKYASVSGYTQIADIDFPRSLEHYNFLEFGYRIRPTDEANKKYPFPSSGYSIAEYDVRIRFQDQKPYRLVLEGIPAILSPYDLTQKALSSDDLRKILYVYFCKGPTLIRSRGYES